MIANLLSWKVQSHPCFLSSGTIFTPAEGLVFSSEFWWDCCTVYNLIGICIGQRLDGGEAQEITFSLIPLSGSECNAEALASGEASSSMFRVFWLRVCPLSPAGGTMWICDHSDGPLLVHRSSAFGCHSSPARPALPTHEYHGFNNSKRSCSVY